MVAVLTGLLALSGTLAACTAPYEPKEYTADDRCRDCGRGGGIFTGEDGVFEYEF
jgi:hypothetical protein